MRRQFRELYRLFFGRFLENDLICLDGDTTGTLTGILALLAAPGLFLPFFEFVQFGSYPLCVKPWQARDMAALPDKALHVGLAMTVLGIVTALEWDAILPDRRDTAVLRPLPVRLGVIFAAKIAALAKFWLAFTLVLSGVSSVFFPMAVIQNSPLGLLLWYVRAHVTAVLAGNAFVFLAMIAAQGLLLNVLGWRRYRRWAPLAQSALVTALLAMFFTGLGTAFMMRPDGHATGLLLWLPPAWFVGLYQTQLGWTQPVFVELAAMAKAGLPAAAGLAAAGYALSYRKSVTRAFEDADGPAAAAPGVGRRLLEAAVNRALLPTPAQRASFHFVWNTMLRSRSHRVLAATYAGVGFALVFQSLAGMLASGNRAWLQRAHPALLAAPLVLSLFILYGLRYAFTVPAELRANWLFQVAGRETPGEYLAGARKAALLLGVVPLYALLLPVHVTLWGWTLGGLHVLYGLTVAWLLMHALMLNLDKLPFTCSYVPGKANLKASWPLYVIAYLAYVSAFSALEYFILQSPSRFPLFLAGAAAARLGMESWRRRMLAGEFALVFDERPEPAVRTLGLQE
jgi:hypothetical protein